MKNALLIVLAFALGGGAMWYFTNDRGAAGAPGAAAAGAGGRPPAAPGRFRRRYVRKLKLPLVTVGRAHRDQIYDVVEALGTAQANESVTLTAKVTDTVRRVNFEDGDYVEAGAVLIELTNQEEEALLAEARANLDDAESQLRRLDGLERPRLDLRFRARRGAIAGRRPCRRVSTASSRGCAIG